MERYQILSTAPVGVVDTQSSHREYPQLHGSFADVDEAETFAEALRSTYRTWQMPVKVVVFDTIAEKTLEK